MGLLTLDTAAHAPVLVMCGSLAADAGMWQAQAAAWRGRARLLAYEYAGHGSARDAGGPDDAAGIARDVLRSLDAAGVRDFLFLGLSLGGMVGLAMAAAAPARVRRLAVANCRYYQTEQSRGDWTARIALVGERGTTALAGATAERWLAPAFRAAYPEAERALAAMVAGTRADGYARAARAVRDFDARPWLDGIDVPTLVLAGELDAAAPPAHMRELADRLGARFVCLPGCAHLASVQCADAFTREVGEFLFSAGPLHEPPIPAARAIT